MLNIAQAIVIAALCVVPQSTVRRESVDRIEINAYFDEQGREIFTQAIFWDWDGERYQVRAWRMVKEGVPMPSRDWAGGYKMLWDDADTVREVRTPSVVQTWTQHDVEVSERETLPKEQRKELLGVGYDRPSGAMRPITKNDAD
jgi:hypothetical protein